jgi:hypothetical protein
MALNQFKEFTKQTVTLDGKEYETCTFRECTLIFCGGEPPRFYDCAFESCDWDLAGVALNTIGFLLLCGLAGMKLLSTNSSIPYALSASSRIVRSIESKRQFMNLLLNLFLIGFGGSVGNCHSHTSIHKSVVNPGPTPKQDNTQG